MTLGRRKFLQRLGSVLAALGISDMALAGTCGTYQQALARSSRRLALLVGINQYPDSVWQAGAPLEKGALLQGALMDVELQRELLINRFSTNPEDIVTLTNEQATRQGILDAIRIRLSATVEPGDTVIFHFSGLGSKAYLRSQSDYLPTLVPVDGTYPETTTQGIHDLFEETLAVALNGLEGVRVITVLDASSATPRDSVFQGNFRVRSRSHIPSGQWNFSSSEEGQIPSKTAEQLSSTWPGILLRASKPNSPALEGTWNGFSAGVFTYALTQQIWNSFPAQRQYWIFHRAERLMETWVGASVTPQFQGELSGRSKDNLLLAGSVPRPAAAGVVKAVDAANKSASLWLGGLPAYLLPYCSLGMRLQPLPNLPGLAAAPGGSVLVKSLDGLKAKADFSEIQSLPPGTPLVEVVRRLPHDPSLVVALDPALERIERVDATSTLAGLAYVTTTPPGEQQVDCLFGRLKSQDELDAMTDEVSDSSSNTGSVGDAGAANLQPQYCLFAPDHTPVPGTSIEGEEAIKTAISRLSDFLRSLLAVKILRLTVNPVSSQLPLRMMLEVPDSDQLMVSEETLRSRQFAKLESTTKRAGRAASTRAPNNQQFRLHLWNLGQQPLYYLFFSVVDGNTLSVYCPPLTKGTGSEQMNRVVAEASQLPPDMALAFPNKDEGTLSFQPLQSVEFFAIASTAPFYQTWKVIRSSNFQQLNDRLARVNQPLLTAKALLSDLHRAGAKNDKQAQGAPQESTVSLQAYSWATLSLRSPTDLG